MKPTLSFYLATGAAALLLTGCGMKGPLQQPPSTPPPPADPALVAPPTLPPSTSVDPQS